MAISNSGKAVLLMATAVLMLPVMDAVAKLVSATIPSTQVAWTRFAFQIVLMAPFVVPVLLKKGNKNIASQALLGILLSITMVLIFAAIKFMPITDAIAIFFVEPLLVIIFSVIFLGEKIGWRRILAVMMGFLGALIIIRPSYSSFGLTAILPLGAAFSFAVYIVLTRNLAQIHKPAILQFNSGISGFIFLSLALLLGYILGVEDLNPAIPTVREWLLLGMAGIITTIGHFMIILAFRYAEASILAPFQYLEIVSATIYGLWLFNDFPDYITWVGILIIVGSGLYIFHRERIHCVYKNKSP